MTAAVNRRGHALLGDGRRIGRLVILVFILGYWIFVWQLERVDYSQAPPALWQRVLGLYPLFDVITPYILIPAEFVSLRVLRHFVPFVAGWWLARHAIARWLESFCDLPDLASASSMLGRLASGGSGASAKADPAAFTEERQRSALLRVGGPGKLFIGAGNAAVTEINGRFVRVVGPGSTRLGRFEYPCTVVDVRPQERALQDVGLVTADGIPLSAHLSVSFHISWGDKTPGREEPFPYDETAVQLAAYAQTSGPGGQISGWEARVMAAVEGELRTTVAEYRLDELVPADNTGHDAYRLVQSEVERRVRDKARNLGVDVHSVRLVRLALPDEVTQQHVDYWRSLWDLRQRRKQVEQEALALEESEIARAEAEAVLVQAIAEGLRRMRLAGSQVGAREIAAIRFIEALESVAQQTQEVLPLPEEMMPNLHELRRALLAAGDPQEEDRP